MSYILDALKRADAERERGHVPGLHAQPLPGPAAAGSAPGLPRWALGAGVAATLVMVAALAWRLGADTTAPVPATLAVPEAVAPAPITVGESPHPSSVPPATAAVRPNDEPVALAPVPTAPARPAQAPPATAPEVPPAVTPAANTALPLYAQLPAGTRQQFPALAVTGSVYSEDASARFVMLNGDVVKEGSQPAPGLVVERIEPRSVVLRFKGERFRLPY